MDRCESGIIFLSNSPPESKWTYQNVKLFFETQKQKTSFQHYVLHLFMNKRVALKCDSCSKKRRLFSLSDLLTQASPHLIPHASHKGPHSDRASCLLITCGRTQNTNANTHTHTRTHKHTYTGTGQHKSHIFKSKHTHAQNFGSICCSVNV